MIDPSSSSRGRACRQAGARPGAPIAPFPGARGAASWLLRRTLGAPLLGAVLATGTLAGAAGSLVACGSADATESSDTPLGKVQASALTGQGGIEAWDLALDRDGSLLVSATSSTGAVVTQFRVRNGVATDGTAVHDVYDATGVLELTEDGRVLTNTLAAGSVDLMARLNDDLSEAIAVNLLTRGCLLVSASYTSAIAFAAHACITLGTSATCISASAQVAAPSIELRTQCMPSGAAMSK